MNPSFERATGAAPVALGLDRRTGEFVGEEEEREEEEREGRAG